MQNTQDNIVSIEYKPSKNRNLLQYSVLRIRVRVRTQNSDSVGPYKVIIRTNLCQSGRIRRQMIDLIERGQSYSTDFYDIPAIYDVRENEYKADVLLNEVGYFEFKPRVESANKHQPWVKWAPGPNIGISVCPLEYGRNNSIYCAFIRQFVKDKNKASLRDEKLENTIRSLEEQGAFVIPPGGNFDNFKEELPFIIEDLGMKIIHLLPINPVPVSYGRMGMYGSPYATTDYFGIDHTYGTFSRYKTIEDQFLDLTSTIHELGAKVLLDMVINHTGWASTINFTHSQWRKVDKNGKIISPGAWDVVWGDLVELDYKHRDLWKYMAEVFLVWCRRGIDGFRLDAGYMVPLEVWQYIISKVREEYPHAMFLLEGLGGPWETTEKLLTEGQMNWAYSELFQNYSREQIFNYLDYAQRVSAEKGLLVHYAETHDNDRLAKKGKIYARMRLYISALTSFVGAWGFANGVEWLATEKIDVHRNAGLNWGNPENLVSEITRLNRILNDNPAFWDYRIKIVDLDNADILAFYRTNRDLTNIILCVINLNVEQARSFRWPLAQTDFAGELQAECALRDLFTENQTQLPVGKLLQGTLSPGGCLIYRLLPRGIEQKPTIPAIYDVSGGKTALIYRILLNRFKPHEVGRIDQEKLLHQVNDFRKFIVLVNTATLATLIRADDFETLLNEIPDEMVDRHSAVWTFSDRNKQFIISGDKWLLTYTFLPCTAYLKTPGETIMVESIPTEDQLGYLAFFPPQPENQTATLTFNWKIKRDRQVERQWQNQEYPILSAPSGLKAVRSQKIYPLKLQKQQLVKDSSTVLLTNGVGSYCQCSAIPQQINSKYDCLLAVATDSADPANRLALVKTAKETVQIGDKYFDLDESFLTSFTRYPQPLWEFSYDDGEYFLILERSLVMPYGENELYVRYKLREANVPVTLISKFYLECRGYHDQSRADQPLPRKFEQASRALSEQVGVGFAPIPELSLRLIARHGEFVSQPHWIYDIDHPLDRQRGYASKGDAFSPGFFSVTLGKKDSQSILITTSPKSIETISAHRSALTENARVKNELVARLSNESARKDPLAKMLVTALDQFLVRGPSGWQVLSGYPWLGVGTRDALFCVDGLLAAGREDVAEDVILNAAHTEKDGLLADWLSGGPKTCLNVESSLRLFLAADNFVRQTGKDYFWESLVGDQRSIREVLVDIYEKFRDGSGINTAAGSMVNVAGKSADGSPVVSTVIRADRPALDFETGLLYCPAGSTWMNTSNPAATPRAGFPVEIQAQWYQVLEVLAKVYPPYAEEARQIRDLIIQNFTKLFWSDQKGYLADVLIASNPNTSRKALSDYALRFNQLAAVHAGLVSVENSRVIVDKITSRLLVSASLRSLAEMPLAVPLKIVNEQGELLADPRLPYQGSYTGNETQRRLAFHNGTAWPWAYPGYVEARAAVFDFSDLAVKQALAFFEPFRSELTQGVLGSISEIKDGNFPHTPRGCGAYALSVAEVLRVYLRLKYQQNHHQSPQQTKMIATNEIES
ncbi:MAG: glycogen debranching enzyme N-terminal domain-containing protein [Sedimentisphaerales bacterium]|nr:glycogen debranching enzyme N-terminal domain-containing protein [Sedimentisphaerales bacterium]